MATLLDGTARRFGPNTATIDDGTERDWNEFTARAAGAAAVLRGLGIGACDRFAILGRNSTRQAELIHAAWRCGAVATPLNFRLAAPEIALQLEDADCRVLFVDVEFAALARSARANGRHCTLVALDTAMRDGDLPSYEELHAAARSVPLPEAEAIGPASPALLLYTGGTSGRPKGVLLSHGNLASVATQVAAAMAPRAGDRYLHVAPMFHSADLSGNAWTLAGAAHCYLGIPKPFEILEAIERHRITVTVLPPSLLRAVLEAPDFDRFDLSSLRLLLFGAAPLDPAWIERAQRQLPRADLWHGYGLTETAQMLTLTRVPRAGAGDDRRLRSCGRALRETELRILAADGRECPAGTAGEVCARGPQIPAGYLNRPDETGQAFRDGWFRTGDVGTLDADGYLYLLDRLKDMVVTGGENVYTLEVETVLARHPGVADVAVVGVPDELHGEALLAVVVPGAGARPSPAELIEHCRAYIGGFKIPRRYLFRDELPRSALGKVLKQQLRAEADEARAAQM